MRRDFTYIDDIVDGVLKAIEHIPSPAPPCRIYNLGNNHSVELEFFIETLEQALGKKAVKRYLPMQEGDVLCTEADIEDTRRDLGWAPHTDIAEGLTVFAGWFNRYIAGY
jgi:UDP-glucuronate 4-epimerase